MKRWIAGMVAVGSLLGMSLAGAQDELNRDVSTGPNANAVVVGGTPIMRVRYSAGGFTPEQRAAAIQRRVNKLLGVGPIHESEITVEPFGDEAVVRVKGILLFTADNETAHANDSTPMDLANRWADHMRGVLPRLTEPK